MDTLLDYFLHLDVHLTAFVTLYGPWVYAIMALVVFAETGLVVTPFLPGDSLLFAAGALAAGGSLDLTSLLILLSIAAIVGIVAISVADVASAQFGTTTGNRTTTGTTGGLGTTGQSAGGLTGGMTGGTTGTSAAFGGQPNICLIPSASTRACCRGVSALAMTPTKITMAGRIATSPAISRIIIRAPPATTPCSQLSPDHCCRQARANRPNRTPSGGCRRSRPPRTPSPTSPTGRCPIARSRLDRPASALAARRLRWPA